jgi:hypothetical protein
MARRVNGTNMCSWCFRGLDGPPQNGTSMAAGQISKIIKEHGGNVVFCGVEIGQQVELFEELKSSGTGKITDVWLAAKDLSAEGWPRIDVQLEFGGRRRRIVHQTHEDAGAGTYWRLPEPETEEILTHPAAEPSRRRRG